MRTFELLIWILSAAWALAAILRTMPKRMDAAFAVAPIDIRRAHRIINDYTIAFFERYPNGVPAGLVDGMSPAPDEEVTVTSRNVPAAAQASRR
jgi:hypothetical protein